MSVLSRHRFTDRLLGVGSIGALIAAMAAIDERVGGQLAGVLSGDSSNKLALAGANLQRAVRIVTETVGDYSAGHTPLVFFGLAALALVLLMLRP